ncbi:sugar phosphate isomerase/epimerase family protein [Sphingomonas bacterium]|uniref:sugar phosphate isomerase/epimerase family protein n=1 Tax=Sphingomonas bacterium TaxID=1895847 RepID=UPI0015764936|nr:TIM barrel protein [Sphingomonas bacterium]
MSQLELWSYTFRDTPIVTLAGAAARAGFRWITATPDQIAREGLSTVALRRAIEQQGIGLSAIDGLCTVLPGTPLYRKPGEPTLEHCLELATALGARLVNLVHIGGGPTPIDELAAAFAEACALAAGSAIELAIEFLPGTGIPDLPTCAAVVRASGASNGSILLDTWHLARGGGTVADLDADTAMLVGGLQLADRSPEQDRQPYVPMRGRKLPGEGALPLAEIVRRVLAARPDLPIGLEVLSDEMDELGPEAGSRRLVQACRAFCI